MWDRPDVLDRITRALLVAATVMVLYAIGWTLVRLPMFALQSVRVSGDARHITRVQVQTIVSKELKGTFFTLDLPKLRRAFEKLPWVREVNLRRRWPSELEVNVVEHVAIARWGNRALVNTQGEVFQAAYDGALPVFVGPEGTSKEITIQYDWFRRTFSASGAVPVLVQLTARRAWEVKLDSGPTIELGRDDIEERLNRYLQVYARTVGALNRRVDYVDLRYRNGFAVRIPELKGDGAAFEHGPRVAKRKAKGI